MNNPSAHTMLLAVNDELYRLFGPGHHAKMAIRTKRRFYFHWHFDRRVKLLGRGTEEVLAALPGLAKAIEAIQERHRSCQRQRSRKRRKSIRI
jgi:hypothetical protein